MTASPKRPLRVTHVVLGLEVGGLERQVLDLVGRVDPGIVSADIVCTDVLGALASLCPLEKPVVTVGARPGYDWGAVMRLARHFRQMGTDIVHTHNERADYLAVLAGRLAGVRVHINTRHDPYDRPSPRAALRRWALGVLSDAVVGVSSVVRDAASGRDRVSAHKVRVICNGTDVDAPQLERAEARRQLGFDDADFVIGAAGRLAPQKDYSSFVDAFARIRTEVPGVAGIVFGDGPLAAELIEEARARGLDRLRFAGYRDNVVELMPAFDLFVQSSLNEGISLSIIEAMATRLPVVATAVGGSPEALGDGEAGVLVPPNDAAALAAAITALAQDRERRQRLGAAARRRAETRFSIEGVARAYEALYVEQARRRGLDI